MAPLQARDAARILRSGGVVILDTDTLPGLHCRADRPEAVERIFALKGRRPEKALLLLAGSLEQAWMVARPENDRQLAHCRLCWPGPFSLILPARGGLSPLIRAGGLTVAVRVPALDTLRELLLASGHPLVSTSVNLEGKPPCTDLDQAVAAFGSAVDGWWIPPAGQGEKPASAAGRASALVDLTSPTPTVLREGPVAFPLEDPGVS